MRRTFSKTQLYVLYVAIILGNYGFPPADRASDLLFRLAERIRS